MNKYKDYWYEVKHLEDSIHFCFYDTEDRKNKAWGFNAEFYNFKQCLDTIGNSAGKIKKEVHYEKETYTKLRKQFEDKCKNLTNL